MNFEIQYTDVFFSFHCWEPDRSCINGLGRWNFYHIRLVLIAKVYKSLFNTESVQLKSMYEQLRWIDSNYVSLGKFMEVNFSLPFFALKSQIVSKFNVSCGEANCVICRLWTFSHVFSFMNVNALIYFFIYINTSL